MSTSRLVRTVFAACAIGALVPTTLGCAASTARSTQKRPNIIFLLTDDLNRDDIAVMPNLKRLLVDQGMTLSDYFVSVSLCCPSRATTLRGQYAHNTGIETNGGTNGGFETAYATGIERSTIATWLQGAGYRTALIGKYLNGYPNGAGKTYVPPGWDEWASASPGAPAYGEFDYTLNENGKLVRYGHEPEDYGTDVYTDKAKKFITEAGAEGKPFFAYLGMYAPHGPATPGPRHEKLFQGARAPRTASFNESDVSDKPRWVKAKPLIGPAVQQSIDHDYRKRLQSVQAVDDSIATLVKTLKANKQLDNTYFVFTSDNGFHLGQHRLPSGKQTAYEEDIHVPLIVRGPGVPAGKSQAAIVGNVDLAPTFADIAGVAAPRYVDGRSFAPLLHGDAGNRRQAYLVAHPTAGVPASAAPDPSTQEPADQAGAVSPRATRRARAAGMAIPAFRGVRTARYTYVEYVTGERELYDLRSDPAQLDNIATTADDTLLAQLSRRVKDLQTCAAARCRALENRPSP